MMTTINNENSFSLKREINWLCVIFNLQLHISFICGLHFIFYEAYLSTIIFSFILVIFGILGVTAGSHRLWAHNSYKANTSLKIFLMICQTLAGHGSIYDWVKIHRLHHKYFNTSIDPFDPSKGFFYSHVISNNLKYSISQEKALKEIDVSDLEKDAIIMFQKKYYWLLLVIITLLLPINAPAEYWNETIICSVFVVGWLRYTIVLHLSWLIHSSSRIWNGKCQLNNNIFFINNNKWLTYHYLIPYDYQTSEYGKYGIDLISKFIKVCSALEYATHLKTVTNEKIRNALVIYNNTNKPIQCIFEVYEENISVFQNF